MNPTSVCVCVCLVVCSGHPIAYHLHPAQGPCLLAQADSQVAQRGLFTTKNLWVTPHVDGQLYPAGTYVFQSSRDSGLGQWTQQVSGGEHRALEVHGARKLQAAGAL